MNLENLNTYNVAGYKEYKPPKYNPAIESIWTHAIPLSAASGGKHHLIPEPTPNITLSIKRGSNWNITSARAALFGPLNCPIEFKLTPGLEIIAIRLKSEWLPHLFGVSANEITNQDIDLHHVSPDLANRMLDLLCDKKGIDHLAIELFQLIKQHSETCQTRHRLSQQGMRAIDLIRSHSGSLDLTLIANHLEISDRHLRRTVQNLIGISPKALSRNLRLLKTIEFADGEDLVNWSDCAVKFGYFDQAHLINDFKALTNLTPTQLMKSRKAESVFSNPE